MKKWSKIERDILHKPIIKQLVYLHGMKGLGIYIVMRNIVDCHDEVNREALWMECNRLVRRSLFDEIVSNTNFFTTDEFGYLKVVNQKNSSRTYADGYTEGSTGGSTEGSMGGSMGAPNPERVPSSEKEIEENKKKNIFFKNKKAFQKPSILEIEEYILENYFNVDASMFYNYYESRGWIFGNAPMTDWHAAIKSWQNNPKFQKVNSNYDETTYINDMY